MKRLLLLLLLTTLAAGVFAQRRNRKTPTTPTPPPLATTQAPAGLFSGPKTGPKPYKEVITDKAVSQSGLFTVHRVDDKYYFEMNDTLMNREIMAVTRFVRVPANKGVGRATYGGELTNQ